MITSENYREIYEELVEETDDFTSESGVVKCTTKKASDIIREILSNYYNIIDYGISDIEEVDGNVYMVIYNDRNDEELSFEEEPFDESEEIEEVPDDIELPEDEDTVQESLSLVEGYLTEGIEESKSFVSEALKKHPEFRELIKAGAWGELQEQVNKYYPQDDIKSESAWGKFLEVLDKSGVKYKIDSIPEYCFRNSDITSFRIPEGTTKIGMCSFERCYNLTSIEIPDSVTDIDFRAFWSCTSLTEIKLPASLEIIGSEAFRNCKNLKGNIVIPDTCHSIMGAAFMKCASLDSITIPKSVTHIGPDCFKECNLKSITLPTKYKYDIKGLGLSGMPRKSIIITESLVEKIVKKGSKWQVQSEKGRNMGTYDTKEKVKERLKQVEYFKHKNESIDDDFKLHHSLKEDIPTFWEWVDDQGLDPDVIEENPDLEEYFRQQYDITFNLKSPEDYDLSDTDIPDDDFQQEEEPLGYHFVCYYEDDDSPGDQTGDAETLEDAIKMCKGYIDKYDYDNAEIFGPNGDTVATFYEGEWNTDYNADINDMDLEEIEEINPNISLCKDNYTGKYYIVDNTNQEILDGGTTSLEKAKQLVDNVKEYLLFGESLNEENEKHLYICDDCGYEVELTDDEYDGMCPNCHEHHGFYRADESLTEEDELKFSPNYNPAGTPIGRGTGLGEELDDEEPSLECLNCGCDTEWLGTQGDLEEFKCPECGEYYYLTKDGRVVGEEAFQESLNSKKKLTEDTNKDLPKKILLNDWEVESIFPGLEYDDVYEPDDDELDDIREKLNDFFMEDYGVVPYDFYWYLNKNNTMSISDITWFDPDEEENTNESLTEAIVNGAFTPETFDKVLRSVELSSDLSDDEFTDKLCDVIYDELRIANSPELRHWEDGYYDCAQAYEELLTDSGRQAVTEFVSSHLFIPGDERLNDLLTEALIDRDMDTIKQSDLLKAPISSVIRIKFNDRPNNTWIDAYSKVDGDNWAVLDDTGKWDANYSLLNSQTLYWSFKDSFDEMTEFEIDTAPQRKHGLNLTDAIIEFYNKNIEKKYDRFCNIYKKAFEKIPNLDFRGLIKYPYIAQSTSRSSLFSVGILGGDDEDSLFELHISADDGSNYAVYYFDESGMTDESNVSGGMAEILDSFNNKKVEIISFTDEVFNAAYDKLSEAIKNAGFKLGESLTEAKNDTLNPAIWENNELKPEVKEKLELIVDKFKERLKEDGVDIDIDDVIIVGSNANYNYTDKSDIDLHLVADLSIYKDKEDLAQVVYNAYRRLFNDKFDPMIYGHEVELYIEPKE